jgi:hypothetical protein
MSLPYGDLGDCGPFIRPAQSRGRGKLASIRFGHIFHAPKRVADWTALPIHVGGALFAFEASGHHYYL